jgi:diguanylate cyclase (GGDEF)-like protein
MYRIPRDVVRYGVDIRTLLETRREPGHHRIDPIEYVNDILRKVQQGGTSTSTIRLDGRVISVVRTPVPGGGWVAMHEDVTDRERDAEQIRRQAYHDALTSLPNRARFMMLGEAAVAATSPPQTVGVLLIDLDRFKAVNDIFGHAAGNLLLQQAAERMRRSVRPGDIVARLGGDEFAILQINDADQRDAPIALAARLIDVLAEPYELSGGRSSIGASIGIAIGSDELEHLMHQADLALYKVKSEGRNGLKVYDDQLGEQSRERQQLEQDLKHAVFAEQFVLHYQPIVSLADQRIVGMEALVRWRHPDKGLLAPDRFIPLAEETGMIVPLSEWIIERACRDAAQWPADVTLAVNISPAHIKAGGLIDVVTRVLLETPFAPERLELEVTETVLLGRDHDGLAELDQLRALGISIALDDFGTGYSSLGHLRLFPFDKIKIDRSFVSEITERADSAAIVCAMTWLARGLNIVATAEGVETEQQMKMLQAAGCSQGQGFLFGRPQPAASLSFADGRCTRSA